MRRLLPFCSFQVTGLNGEMSYRKFKKKNANNTKQEGEAALWNSRRRFQLLTHTVTPPCSMVTSRRPTLKTSLGII